MRPQRRQPTRLPHPWDSPGKNIGVGCHFLLQCMKVKSESEVAQSCPTLSNPMDCSPPGSSIHEIFQARVLEWGAITFSSTQLVLNKYFINIMLIMLLGSYYVPSTLLTTILHILFNSTTALWTRYCYPCFTDEETKAQKDHVSHVDLKSRFVWLPKLSPFQEVTLLQALFLWWPQGIV